MARPIMGRAFLLIPMSIDNKLDQAQSLVRIDEAHRSPGLARLAKRIGEGIATGGLIGAIASFSDALSSEAADISAENSRYLLSIVIDEVKRLSDMSDQLSKEHQEFLDQDWIRLLVDADLKARATRARERVARIAHILSHSAHDGPATPADDVEEMMRIAMQLSDRDVVLLRQLADAQGKMLENQDRIPRYAAWTNWPWGNRLDAELESVFSKLESYGLVSRLAPPNNLNLQADFQGRYALLKKGVQFLTCVQETANQV
jgi:hypothetical protein